MHALQYSACAFSTTRMLRLQIQITNCRGIYNRNEYIPRQRLQQNHAAELHAWKKAKVISMCENLSYTLTITCKEKLKGNNGYLCKRRPGLGLAFAADKKVVVP